MNDDGLSRLHEIRFLLTQRVALTAKGRLVRAWTL